MIDFEFRFVATFITKVKLFYGIVHDRSKAVYTLSVPHFCG